MSTLPPELEREIAELASSQDNATAARLMLVARRMYIWCARLVHARGNTQRWTRIQPILDCIILVSRPSDLARLRALVNSPSSRAESVRHLALSTKVPPEEMPAVLSRLCNITDLTLWTGNTYPGVLLAMQPLSQLHRLSTNLYVLLGAGRKGLESVDPTQLASLSHLTHLDLFSGTSESFPHILAMLPSLTHLAVDGYDPGFIRKALEVCKSLQLLVVLRMYEAEEEEDDRFESEAKVDDERVCTVAYGAYGNFEEDWLAGARGGYDFWRRGEAKAMDKRAAREARERRERRTT